jgi:DNA-binding NarL/FixJ family response regulator
MDGRTDTVRILIAGYTRVSAELLANVLKRDRYIQVAAVVPSSQEVLDVVARCPVDVAVISTNLDEEPEGGLDALRQLRAKHSDVRVILLLDSARPERVVKAFQTGVKGIFSRNSPLTLLSKCVRCVHEGQIWISQEELEVVLDALRRAPAIRAVDARGMSLLTKRELEVVECVAEGLANREIAQRLRLSKHTVKNYLFHVFDKLGVSNRVELLFLTLGRVAPHQEPVETRRNGEQVAPRGAAGA